MSHSYIYGDEISFTHLAEALPKSPAGHLAIWTQPWADIAGLTSTAYGIALSEDVWHFPKVLFREASTAAKGGPSLRTVDFGPLRSAARTSDAEGIVRRAKRMGWLYLHAPKDTLRSTVTAVSQLQRFMALISLLTKARVFTYMPDDACPDGPTFFREITRETFGLLVPKEKIVSNGVKLLNDLPSEIDDRLRFHAETYVTYWNRRARERNTSQGKHAKAVSLTAIDDLNLSKILAVCDAYRKYPELLKIIWDWLEGHRVHALKSGKKTSVYRKSGNRKLAYQVKQAFHIEVFEPKLRDWLSTGLIADTDGTLSVPIYSHLNLVYRTVWDLLNPSAVKTSINSTLYSNSIYLSFLTAVRIQELASLPFDALVQREEEESSHDHIVGQEYKTEDQIEGVARDWPLPRVAISLVTGAQSLQRLRSQALGVDIPKFLFEKPQYMAIPFMRMLIGERLYTGQQDNLIRRMRPSSAQLVADVTRLPLAVQIVLGHGNEEESLGYCRGRADDEYREMVADRKRARDQVFGQEMITEVTGKGATVRMTRGVIKMGIDQIVALNLGDEVAVERARDLQAQIDKVKPTHFSEIYEMIGEDRWQIEQFIGESVAQPRPFQFCTAHKGGVHFSGACSTSNNVTNPKNCKSYCPYNFELNASLELRADWIEKELSRGHFDDNEITTEDPIFYNSAMKILDWVWSFEGALKIFKTDPRLLDVVRRIAQDDDLLSLFKGEARRTLQDLRGQ